MRVREIIFTLARKKLWPFEGTERVRKICLQCRKVCHLQSCLIATAYV